MRAQSKSKVCFYYQSPVTLRNRTALKAFIEKIFKKENRSLNSLNYIFCSDPEILRINREFLKHDYYTDIITFELSGKKDPVEGEIYISVDRIRENSRALDTAFTTELHRVIFHGVLHLCGYRDKSQAEIKEMREKEDYYLGKYL